MIKYSYRLSCALAITTVIASHLSSVAGNAEVSVDRKSLRDQINYYKRQNALRSAHFNWPLHDKLRDLYQRASLNDEAMKECNQLLEHRPFEPSLVQVLSRGEISQSKSRAIGILAGAAQRYNWLPCVVGQCYLTAADLCAQSGDKAEAIKYYTLLSQDKFVGTEFYSAMGSVCLQLIQHNEDPTDAAARIRCIQSAKRDDALSATLDSLLAILYKDAGNEQSAMKWFNNALVIRPDTPLVIDYLSDWQLNKNEKLAVQILMRRAQLYHRLPCVRAACLLAAADIYAVARDGRSAEQLYQSIILDDSPQIAKYRVVAQVSLSLLRASPDAPVPTR